jgi:asparagine synthase (glutamine-hydrolysing)
VAAIAAQALSTAGQPPLRSFTWTFDELASCDERAYIHPLLERYPIDPTYIPADTLWPLKEVNRLPNNPSLPDGNAFRPLKEALYAQAQAAGVRVLLTGGDGDHLYLGADEWLADLLADGRWAEAGREGLRQARRLGLLGLLRSPHARRVGSRLLDRTPGLRTLRPVPRAEMPPWLTHYAAAQLEEADALAPPLRRAWRANRRQVLLGPRAARGDAYENHYANRYGLEVRLPYRDRRLVEFALAVPAHQLYNAGRHKHVLRNAMAGMLPELILQQTRQGVLTPLFTRGLAEREWAQVQRVLHQQEPLWPRFVRSGWLSTLTPERLKMRLAGARTEREGVVLYACVAAERWYKAAVV